MSEKRNDKIGAEMKEDKERMAKGREEARDTLFVQIVAVEFTYGRKELKGMCKKVVCVVVFCNQPASK